MCSLGYVSLHHVDKLRLASPTFVDSRRHTLVSPNLKLTSTLLFPNYVGLHLTMLVYIGLLP
jgi:hypothetical protein